MPSELQLCGPWAFDSAETMPLQQLMQGLKCMAAYMLTSTALPSRQGVPTCLSPADERPELAL